MVYPNTNATFEEMLLKFMSEDDPMLSMLKWLCEQLMEAEVTSKVNAAKSERHPERSGYRSGYRVRRLDTRMGTIYLFVPKLRNGGYIPFFVSEKKRSEAALMNVIQEAYVNGVSTRKIEKLAKSLGIDSISRSQVSMITKELNDQVAAFRERPLQETYPVLWVDALYEKIRDGHHVKNMPYWRLSELMKAAGVTFWRSNRCRKNRPQPTGHSLKTSSHADLKTPGWLSLMPTKILSKPYKHLLSAVAGSVAKFTLCATFWPTINHF